MSANVKTLKDQNGDIVYPRITKSCIQDQINEVPTGGSTNQVLTKTASGYGWQDGVQTINNIAPDSSGNVSLDVSDLPNDAGYQTASQVSQAVKAIFSLSGTTLTITTV